MWAQHLLNKRALQGRHSLNISHKKKPLFEYRNYSIKRPGSLLKKGLKEGGGYFFNREIL